MGLRNGQKNVMMAKASGHHRNDKRPVNRRLWTAFNNEPADPPARDSHSGFLGVEVCHWMSTSKDLLDICSDKMRFYTCIEAGCGPGNWAQVVSNISPRHRSVIAIDNQCRHIDRLNRWNAKLKGCGLSRRNLPIVAKGDFTSDDIPCLNYAIKNRRVVVYLNNFNSYYPPAVQQRFENKLSSCRVGSVVIALDPSFHTDLSWREEVFIANIPRDHVSWRSRIKLNDLLEDTREPVPTYFYKYTKHMPYKVDGRRGRNAAPKKLVYPYLTRRFFGAGGSDGRMY